MLSALLAASAAAVSVHPASLPARGSREAIVALDRAAMVRIAAKGPQGVRCELLDHVRGPFASSGEAGKSSCELELLLDGGTYKLRLTAPPDGEGTIELTARAFAELSAEPVRLDGGAADTRELHAGQQISYWLRAAEKGRLFVRVYGRTAGEVRLWRAGRWLESAGSAPIEVAPRPGQRIYEWWIEPEVAPGEYLMTVYGARPLRWTRGGESDLLHVAAGPDRPSAPRASSLVLPPWGSAVYELEAPAALALLTVADRGGQDATLSLHGFAPGQPRYGDSPACTVGAKSLVRQCAVRGSASKRYAIVLRGEPGAAVRARWGIASETPLLGDGEFAPPATAIDFRAPATGEFLAAVSDVPADRDAPPLSCRLWRTQAQAAPVSIADDLLQLSPRRPFDRRFNYDGNEASIWFEATEWGYYTFQTSGERKSRCELFTLDGRERLTDSKKEPGCALKKLLQAGKYELKLYGGIAGIERLAISGATTREKASGRTKSACSPGRVHLDGGQTYRLELSRAGTVAARGLLLRPLPLRLDEPAWLDLDAGAELRLPLETRGASFACNGTDAVCKVPAGAGEVTLRNDSAESISVSLQLDAAPPAADQPRPHRPEIEALPELRPGTRVFHDFAREQRRAFTFDVRDAGLYDVATEGLLATSCELRTPVVPELARDESGGRGRNCLLQAYLRPGSYLLDVRTVGRSRGRAALVLARRAPSVAQPVETGGDAFFRAPAGELLQQRITVAPFDGSVTLETAAQGAQLSCRLDDADGWPVIPVPSPCSGEHRLKAGKYLWTQLPLPVETLRHTRVANVRPAAVLTGDRPHRIELDQTYAALLSKKGRDELRFTLEAEMDVAVHLTSAMQGRLYRLEDDPGAAPIEVVPPQEDAAVHRAHLAAGAYRLVTEHSRDDVAIEYTVRVSPGTLAPGMTRDVSVPLRTTLRLPRAGTLRLKTEGDAAVRCRILDPSGRLLAESSGHGDDWNCALAAPLPAGDLTLVIESETLKAGATRLSLKYAREEDAVALGERRTLQLGDGVAISSLAAARPDSVIEVQAVSEGRFSCAIESRERGTLFARSDTSDCSLIVKPGGDELRLRLWTLEGPAKVDAQVRERRVERTIVARRGRYQTGEGVLCLPARERGVFASCGPEASLEAGPMLFSAPVSLRELVVRVEGAHSERRPISRQPFIARVASAQRALHLMTVRVPAGDRASPACQLGQGARVQSETSCHAAAGLAQEAVARFWTAQDATSTAEVTWLAVAPPDEAAPLPPGRQPLQWSGEVGRFALPPQPVRIELTLPAAAWAVQVDPEGNAVAVCAPANGAAGLDRCILGGQGGELFLHSPGEPRAVATVLRVSEPSAAVTIDSLYEERPASPGTQVLLVKGGPGDRELSISGALRCVVQLDDGVRSGGCSARIAAFHEARVTVDRDAPWRAVLAEPGNAERALFALETSNGAPPDLPLAHVEPLRGALLQRTLRLSRPSVVHVRADQGVCGLFGGNGALVASDGLGGPCELHRWMPAGEARLVVRSFAGAPLSGSLHWTADPVQDLGEGVAAESWIEPGQVRFFRFEARAGSVGLGVQAPADVLECALLDARQRTVGEGCQQLLDLAAGSYLLSVRAPASARALRFKPVLVGLKGRERGVPDDYLRDFFKRIGGE